MRNVRESMFDVIRDMAGLVNEKVICGRMKVAGFNQKTGDIFRQKNGSGYIETAIQLLVAVVIGALLLAGLYTLFQDTVLPEVTERVKNLFDYKG